jgi:hypothetical protein
MYKAIRQIQQAELYFFLFKKHNQFRIRTFYEKYFFLFINYFQNPIKTELRIHNGPRMRIFCTV